jgi:hypothetical protein
MANWVVMSFILPVEMNSWFSCSSSFSLKLSHFIEEMRDQGDQMSL